MAVLLAAGILAATAVDRIGLTPVVGYFVARAWAAIPARSSHETAEPLVRRLRQRYSRLDILVHASADQAAARLREAGATVCVGRDQSDHISLAMETLHRFGVPDERVQRWVNAFRPDPEWEKADKAHAK